MGLAIPWTELEVQTLKDNYGKIKIEQLEKLIPSRSRGAIQKEAGRRKIKGNHQLAARKLFFDDNFFSRQNIISAYWAGFIAADGSIGKGNSLHISLSLKDEKHIIKFSERIKYNGKISRHQNSISPEQQYSKISIWGANNIVSNLQKTYNIISNKTDVLKPPKITNRKNILAYIAGYFDGDGCLWETETSPITWSVCGNYDMICWIREIMLQEFRKKWPNNRAPLFTITTNGISKTNYRITCQREMAIKMTKILEQNILSERMERKLYEQVKRHKKLSVGMYG